MADSSTKDKENDNLYEEPDVELDSDAIALESKILWMVSELEALLNHKFDRVVSKGPLSLLFKLVENEYHQAAASLLPDVKEQIVLFKEDISEVVQGFGEKLLSDNSPVSDFFIKKLAVYFTDKLVDEGLIKDTLPKEENSEEPKDEPEMAIEETAEAAPSPVEDLEKDVDK